MTYEYVPKLIRAALNNDRKNIESIALMIGRKLKKEDPNISAEIMRILACTNSGSDVMRSMDLSPVPVYRKSNSCGSRNGGIEPIYSRKKVTE